MRIAILADTHGNLLALEAVLADLRAQAPDLLINLGDLFTGPFDPAGSADVQIALVLLSHKIALPPNRRQLAFVEILAVPVGGSCESLAKRSQSPKVRSYIAELVSVINHADRATPLHDYCAGLLLPGERKSVEPIAALTAPACAAPKHQSLLHFVANAPWSDSAVLAKVRQIVLPKIERLGAIVASIVDDTTFPKKGRHSVGVARQWCGQRGKQDNCQSLVSLSLANFHASLPIAHRLFLPHAWTTETERRTQAKIPAEIGFQTKPDIALDQVRAARAAGVDLGTVLADSGFGNDSQFRQGVSELGQPYAVSIQSNLLLWQADAILAPQHPGGQRLSKPKRRALQISAQQLAQGLPAQDWQEIAWNEAGERLCSRFARRRVRAATAAQQPAEEWLLIEWPADEKAAVKYWLSTLPGEIDFKALVETAKLRWRIERDYQELKQEVGLGHYEGRGWRGLHHHMTLCIAAYGFLVAERAALPPSGSRTPRRHPPIIISTGPRSARASAAARAAYPRLDRNFAAATGGRSGPAYSTLSVLRQRTC